MPHFVLIIRFMSNGNSAQRKEHLFVVIMSPCRSLGTYLPEYTPAAHEAILLAATGDERS